MVLARNREIKEKQVFGINGHEILIFQYYSKNKYCSNSDVKSTYAFLYKLVDQLQSSWPLNISTTRATRQLLVLNQVQNRYFSTKSTLMYIQILRVTHQKVIEHRTSVSKTYFSFFRTYLLSSMWHSPVFKGQ